MLTLAILPVKSFSAAKQRLGATVAEAPRRDLTRAMLADVLVALGETRAINRTIVVTREPDAATAARSQGAWVVPDDAEEGQSAAVALALERALAAGAGRTLLVPGDCPAVDPTELEELLAPAPADREVVIVPDRHGTGTNGLALTPPGVIAPSFGPGSCERHRALATAAGAACRIERPASLLLDVDTGDDLQALRRRLSGDLSGAIRTRAVLDRLAGAVPAS